MLKRLLGKLLILAGCILVCWSVIYQVMLIYEEFGGLNSGYLVFHWSLFGVFGIVLLPIGLRLLEHDKDKNDKDKKE